MVATSSRDCAGLHLPEVSTLVFYAYHFDREVAKQAIGRAQRVGRDHSLEVIELVDQCENERLILRRHAPPAAELPDWRVPAGFEFVPPLP